MYCSISCSRAWRSPCSWYRRRRTLSFSATLIHPLHEPDAVAVDPNVVDHGPQDPAQAELLVVAVAGELLGRLDGADTGLERAVDERHRNGHLALSFRAVEDRRQRELE